MEQHTITDTNKKTFNTQTSPKLNRSQNSRIPQKNTRLHTINGIVVNQATFLQHSQQPPKITTKTPPPQIVNIKQPTSQHRKINTRNTNKNRKT